jgi:hypothetical protein
MKSSAWMVKLGWVLTWLSAVNMIGDSTGKMFFQPAQLLSEVQRLGESEIPLVALGILQCTVGVLYLIPRTAILGAILMTGFLGGAEAIQIRVSGSGAFLITLPLFLGVLAWAGIWLRDERVRDLLPLRTPLPPRSRSGLSASSFAPSRTR